VQKQSKGISKSPFLAYIQAYQVPIRFYIIFLRDVKGMKQIIPDIISLDDVLWYEVAGHTGRLHALSPITKQA